ncbi:zona pellucida sperm-binding protein 3-like [Odontesthes bonariensis]|uniref:zona pellucida sperm-binding protein 3-like n=1 Tax=Odontesthes bonariensis TaxID=219752 RepID=UPI003F587234
MSRVSVSKLFALCILSNLVTVKSHTYQTKPLFLSYSDMESNSQFEDPEGNGTTADSDQVETFVVKCLQDSIEVKIRASLFDPSLPLEPTRWRLGPPSAAGDGCTAGLSSDGEYVIRAPLAECGSKVMFTESAVLYNNLLLFFPPSSHGDTFQTGAAIPVLCQYKRRYTVSSGALSPTWNPLVSVQSAHLNLNFHLRLMTSDWSRERSSTVYFMGEMVNMEASVDHDHHPPLRLYAGDCVATLTPDVDSDPRYPFIDHQGCFTDSQLSGSSSRFLPRVRNKLLQIQLEPFLFHQDHRHNIYVTCHLEAVPVSRGNPEKKACSFISGRWRSVDGDHHVCESCDSAAEMAHVGGDEFGHERVQRSNGGPAQHGHRQYES